MRLVFFGSGAFGRPTLAELSRRHQVELIVTQPDRPAGRGGKLTPTPIAAFAHESLPSVPVIKPEQVNTAETVAQIRGVNADAWVVIAFGQKLGRALLDGVFAINLHASLLPRWRGAAPINAAVLAGDTRTGNSVITLADRMDAGLVLGQSFRDIDRLQTAGELHDLLAGDGPELVDRVLREHAEGRLNPVTQDDRGVTIAGKLSKDDGVANFQQPADFLRRQIHALTPWPGVSATVGAVALKLLRADAEDGPVDGGQPAVSPGTLIDAPRGVIACGGGSRLRVLEVQPAGRRPMAWDEFMRGAGRSLASGAMVISERSERPPVGAGPGA